MAAGLGSRWGGYRAEVAIQVVALAIVAGAIVVALLVDPAPLKTPAFAIAISIVIAASGLAAVVGRTDSDWLLLVPILDMIALIVMRQLPEQHVHAIGYLAFLPALWLGWSGKLGFAVVAVLLSLGLIEVPTPGANGALDLEEALSNFLIPAMGAVSTASTYIASRRVAASIGSLVAQERETAAALAREKRSFELLDGMLNAVDVGIVAYDAHGQQILANRSVLVHPVSVVNQRTTLELERDGFMMQADRKTPVTPGRGIISRALAGDEYSNQVVWIRAGDGGQHAISASARPLSDASGAFSGTVIALDDVTAYLETIAAKDAFVSAVSHEFRTPLASIVGYVELLLDDSSKVQEDTRENLLVIERNADRLQVLVNNLIETAAQDKDAVRLQREFTDLVALCESVIERHRPAASTARVSIVLEAEGAATAIIDPVRVARAISNLVSNAVRFSAPDGQVTVRVGESAGAVHVAVVDTGEGIPPELLEALTSPFYRAISAGEYLPGVGLALAVTKAIAAEHDGSVAFASAIGRGTTVTVTLPVR
ncbi:signal transduction histidine kinase [Mycetocola sp. CAN_C7]|uniref:sensor histidine kinase n=1 Tax=Mycetocola sp. CAN_C7 TaxID=2787724 RepID=UPI0018C9E4E4